MSFVSFIQNQLTRHHRLFSCCASCDEIKAPLRHYLCASLEPAFPVDALWMPEERRSPQEVASCVRQLRQSAPWLRQVICLVPGALRPTMALQVQEALFPESEELYAFARANGMVPTALPHRVQALAEHYLLLKTGTIPSGRYSVLDFFTPNGIPLVYTDSGDRSEAGSTGEKPAQEHLLEGPFSSGLHLLPVPLAARCKSHGLDFYPEAQKLAGKNHELIETAWEHYTFAAGLAIPGRFLPEA